MGGHHHHGGGRGFRGGYPGYGVPIIIEETYDPDDVIGEEKAIALSLGPPAAVAAVPAPLSTTPDAGLVAAATAPVATPKTVTAVPVTPKKSLAPAGGALAGGAVGFMVGGPIGAAIGLAVGYLGGKSVSKHAAAPTTAAAPPATPKVSGDTVTACCDNTAGWSPHGDERMR
jgi:hypothetical protein